MARIVAESRTEPSDAQEPSHEWGPPVALVTGAGSGIGREVALRLAAEGFRLALAGRTLETLEETGRRVSDGPGSAAWVCIRADLADADDVQEMIDAVDARFGRLDVLVNNAGWSPLAGLGRVTPDEIDMIFRVNAIGPIQAIAAAWPIFERQGVGTVVNVSSYATVDPFPGLSVYGAAKASLNVITMGVVNESETWERRPGTARAETAPGVRAFTIAPGAVETPLLRGLFGTDVIPKARTLDPADVASVILDCIAGRRDRDIGQTILLPSP